MSRIDAVKNLKSKIDTRNTKIVTNALVIKNSLIDFNRKPILILRSTKEDSYFKFSQDKAKIIKYRYPNYAGGINLIKDATLKEKEIPQSKYGIIPTIASSINEYYKPVILKFDSSIDTTLIEDYLSLPITLPTENVNDWKKIFEISVFQCAYIFIFIHLSEYLVYEMNFIRKNQALLSKTIVYMPPTEDSDKEFKRKTINSWKKTKKMLKIEGMHLPKYDPNGILYLPDKNFQVLEKTSLEGAIENFEKSFYDIIPSSQLESPSISQYLTKINKEFRLWDF